MEKVMEKVNGWVFYFHCFDVLCYEIKINENAPKLSDQAEDN